MSKTRSFSSCLFSISPLSRFFSFFVEEQFRERDRDRAFGRNARAEFSTPCRMRTTTMCSSPRSVGRVLVIDYSSSARDVPSSTPTARCQTKRTPFFFPPLSIFFSRSLSPTHSSSLLPSTWSSTVDGARWCARRRCSPRNGRVFSPFPFTNDWRRVILQVHEASNRSHFPRTFALRWRLRIFILPVLRSRVREKRVRGNIGKNAKMHETHSRI